MKYFAGYIPFVTLCAILSMRWSMELGYGQLAQFIWGIGGFLLGPVVPLILYLRIVRKKEGIMGFF